MLNRFSLVSVSALAFALAACGGPEAEEDTAEDTIAVEEDVTETADDAAGDDAAEGAATAEDSAQDDAGEETVEPEASATPTPTASATATAAPRPTASATRAAPVAVAQPASFATCMVCHATTPGQNGVGPSLAGVFGRKAGSASGYTYSPGMQAANVTWNAGTLERYLVDPSAVVPGSSMPAPGLNAAQAKEVVAYLKSL